MVKRGLYAVALIPQDESAEKRSGRDDGLDADHDGDEYVEDDFVVADEENEADFGDEGVGGE